MQILNKFMSVGSPHQWIDYLMPEDCGHYKRGPGSSIDDTILPDSTSFYQLMVEARAVLSRYLYVLVGKNKKAYHVSGTKIIISFTMEFTQHKGAKLITRIHCMKVQLSRTVLLVDSNCLGKSIIVSRG